MSATYTITASGAVIPTTRSRYVSGTLTVTAAALTDHRRQPDQGLRRGAADPDGQLHGLRQWRHLRQPDHPAHADDDGHRQQPCLGQPLYHHRQWRGRCRLHDHLCRGEPHRHRRAALDHRRQPDQGLRRGAADPDGQLHRLRQRRHLGQPDDSAHADDYRHRQQPCRRHPYTITASGAADPDYSISYVAGTLDRHPGGA